MIKEEEVGIVRLYIVGRVGIGQIGISGVDEALRQDHDVLIQVGVVKVDAGIHHRDDDRLVGIGGAGRQGIALDVPAFGEIDVTDIAVVQGPLGDKTRIRGGRRQMQAVVGFGEDDLAGGVEGRDGIDHAHPRGQLDQRQTGHHLTDVLFHARPCDDAIRSQVPSSGLGVEDCLAIGRRIEPHENLVGLVRSVVVRDSIQWVLAEVIGGNQPRMRTHEKR